ncbi:MAG: rRNA maturation RNase YbeY [Clostridia bacterium]|nr:rRNA maturation RNase YbeY [Clostridia bacterium]MBQ5812558.1 rRNA maturation RNase YbeY [Clostridia bacterium]
MAKVTVRKIRPGKLQINILGEEHLRDAEAEGLIRRAADAAFSAFDYPFRAYVDITLTDDEGIHVINREQREVDRSTDVLSFPMNDFTEGVAPDMVEYDLDPETGRLPLGDMVISVETARRQGEEYGHGFERECAYLTVHSMLHLMGYDHLDEGEMKARMREMEEKIMKVIGLERK